MKYKKLLKKYPTLIAYGVDVTMSYRSEDGGDIFGRPSERVIPAGWEINIYVHDNLTPEEAINIAAALMKVYQHTRDYPLEDE